MKVENTGGNIARIDDGIWVIPGRKGGGCNVYVLKGSQRIALIDLGLPDDHDFIEASLRQIGLSFADVGLAILTHEHVDHVGGLMRLPTHVVVAAHARAANKLRLDDQFSMMSGAFNAQRISGHVDIHLENGSFIDLGGLQLRTIYTPGHCSGSICLFEPNRSALFTADTIFAGGILGGIFASGNVSDYIDSLERLRELKLRSLYPGHGRVSSTPYDDLDRGIHGSSLLMSDTKTLFDAINVKSAFDRIKRGTVDYSRRAAERRQDSRLALEHGVLVHLDDADHLANLLNISKVGLRLDRRIPLAIGARATITIDGVTTLDSQVVDHSLDHTRLKFLVASTGYPPLLEWLEERRVAHGKG